MHKTGVLFVCLGNICRSPLAQGVLEHRLARTIGAGQFLVDSCGTAAFNAGKAPDPRAVAAAERRGYAIATQRARQIHDEDFRSFRHIVAMDNSNLLTLRGWAPEGFSGELRLLMQYAPGSGNYELADPYYAGADAFDTTLNAIETGVEGLLHVLLRSTES